MVFGMFMAILDIQIVSASLPEIQAGLGASSDEISWVQTSYLIAEVVMIPLSGFLGRMMSTRYLFAISAAGFTAASFLCATSSSINEMILWRGVQGFLGGGMIPSVFAAAFTIFPPAKRNIVSPMIGLVATLAPTVGPTVGGYLSHALSWHWLFLVNVPAGIAVTIGVLALVDFDKPEWSLFQKFDWIGLMALAAFLGAMEYVLEEGPNNDWFQDEIVAMLFVVMIVGGILTFWRAFTRDEPLVDFSAFANTNFAVGSVFSFVMGIGLYGMTYLYPLYLSAIRGYDSLMLGQTVFVSGLAMFVSAPLAGMLSSKMDLRLMLLCGFVGFGTSSWMLTGMTADWDFNELFWPQVLRGLSLMICMVPINNLALGALQPDAQSGGRGRAGDDQHCADQPPRPAYCPVGRGGELGQSRSPEPVSDDAPEPCQPRPPSRWGVGADSRKGGATSHDHVVYRCFYPVDDAVRRARADCAGDEASRSRGGRGWRALRSGRQGTSSAAPTDQRAEAFDAVTLEQPVQRSCAAA